MSILVSEIISDFRAEAIVYIPDPTIIPNARIVRLIDKCQRIFAIEGLAFDDTMYINITADKSTYNLPEEFLTPYYVEYDGDRIIPMPKGITTPTTVKYYEIYDNKIVLIDTPEESGDALLKIQYYRLPIITISAITDEAELASKYIQFQDAIVDYLLYEILKAKDDLAVHHFEKFNKAVANCKSRQRKKTNQVMMKLGL